MKTRSREHSLLFLFALSHVVTQSGREYTTFRNGCKRNFFRRIGGERFAEKPFSLAGGSGVLHGRQGFQYAEIVFNTSGAV